eukprot:5646522-Amphidinium_carterae.1
MQPVQEPARSNRPKAPVLPPPQQQWPPIVINVPPTHETESSAAVRKEKRKRREVEKELEEVDTSFLCMSDQT